MKPVRAASEDEVEATFNIKSHYEDGPLNRKRFASESLDGSARGLVRPHSTVITWLATRCYNVGGYRKGFLRSSPRTIRSRALSLSAGEMEYLEFDVETRENGYRIYTYICMYNYP